MFECIRLQSLVCRIHLTITSKCVGKYMIYNAELTAPFEALKETSK